MTSQSPRIYIYKITFEEVLYYYYGVHKEKYFNEDYWGTPVANKWCWDFYTPKKQILQLFDFTDEGWLEAQEVEKRLIRPVYNTDKWCLNENCGGILSLECYRKGGRAVGKIQGKINKENKIGIFSLTTQDRIEIGKKNGRKNYTNGIGCFSLTTEQLKEIGKKLYFDKKGIHAQTPEQLRELGKNTYEKRIGCFSLSLEERLKVVEKTNSQRWMCTETGFITTSGPLTNYQRKRGIDTSKRKRIA